MKRTRHTRLRALLLAASAVPAVAAAEAPILQQAESLAAQRAGAAAVESPRAPDAGGRSELVLSHHLQH